MKRALVFICVTLALYGCSDKKNSPATSSGVAIQKNTVQGSDLLTHSGDFDETTALAAAATLVHAGEGLGSLAAERCWEAEKKRPNIAEACLLAWSIGGQESPTLENVIHTSSKDAHLRTRALSIAGIRRAKILDSFDFNDLLGLLAPLNHDPLWLRAKAVSEWLRSHDPQNSTQAGQLWNALKFDPENSDRLDPASLGLAFTLATKLQLPQADGIRYSYCDPNNRGLAQSRCWRFLSSLPDPATGQTPDLDLFSLFPRRDDGWLLFARSFPERALLLQNH